MNPSPPPHFPPGMPPVPRDHDGASFSEIVPLGSSKIKMVRSPVTLLLVLAALIAPLTIMVLGMMGEARTEAGVVTGFKTFAFMNVFFVVFMVGLLIYLYTRPARPLLSYLWAFALVALMMAPMEFGVFFIFDALASVFRGLMRGDPFALPETAGFFPTFYAHFVGAGLLEELFKAIPILIGLAVGLATIRKPEAMAGPAARFFRIRGPLDGVLMGAFAGAAFIVMETSGQYLPDQLMDVAEQTGRAEAGFASALFLYFPRVIGGAVGHMAYSAVFGYFIGLALLRRRQMIPLLLFGWLFASLLHGLWNSAPKLNESGYAHLVVAAISALCFAAVILKGRQLHASQFGDAPETMGSIVIDRGGGGAPALAPYGAAPQPYGGFPPAPAPYGGFPLAAAAPPVPYGAFPPAPPPAPVFPPPIAPPSDVTEASASSVTSGEQPLSLEIDGLLIPIRAGEAVDFSAEPALGGRGAGARGDVVPHPTRPGVLGLRNSGEDAWTAHLRDGRAQQIDRDQNVRLAPGVRIDFGGGLIGAVVARG